MFPRLLVFSQQETRADRLQKSQEGVLPVCTENVLVAVGIRIPGHIEPWAQTGNETAFIPAPCGPRPVWSIGTVAAVSLCRSPHGDGLSSTCLPLTRTLVAGQPPEARPWLSHKGNVTFLGCRYYNSKLVLPSWLHHIWNLSLMLLLVWAHGAHDSCHTWIPSIMWFLICSIMTNGFRHKLAITYFDVNSRLGVVIGSQIFNLGKLFLTRLKNMF